MTEYEAATMVAGAGALLFLMGALIWLLGRFYGWLGTHEDSGHDMDHFFRGWRIAGRVIAIAGRVFLIAGLALFVVGVALSEIHME